MSDTIPGILKVLGHQIWKGGRSHYEHWGQQWQSPLLLLLPSCLDQKPSNPHPATPSEFTTTQHSKLDENKWCVFWCHILLYAIDKQLLMWSDAAWNVANWSRGRYRSVNIMPAYEIKISYSQKHKTNSILEYSICRISLMQKEDQCIRKT